jgi:hypothetical protein
MGEAMIKIHYKGRLGNKMFQYGNALMTSYRTGVEIANPIKTANMFFQPFKNGYNNKRIIHQDGYFQTRLTINRFFKHKKEETLFSKNVLGSNYQKREGVFVHVRLGDLFESGQEYTCPFEYYAEAIMETGATNGFISSDSPNEEIIKKLQSYFNLKLYNDTPEDTIMFGSTFEHKVLSFGTFSWWIGFFNCQDDVIQPSWHQKARSPKMLWANENLNWKIVN